MKNKAFLTIIAAVLLALGFNLEKFGGLPGSPSTQTVTRSHDATATATRSRARPSAVATNDKWSSTTPKVNLRHIFHGEINRKGKPVGFHSRPQGQDPGGARVVRIKSKPNRTGVYTATIEIRDGSKWKQKFSSFFPDDFNQNEVLTAILNAYKDSSDRDRQPWRGPSGHGFDIQGYTLSRGDINTAFPVYERN